MFTCNFQWQQIWVETCLWTLFCTTYIPCSSCCLHPMMVSESIELAGGVGGRQPHETWIVLLTSFHRPPPQSIEIHASQESWAGGTRLAVFRVQLGGNLYPGTITLDIWGAGESPATMRWRYKIFYSATDASEKILWALHSVSCSVL
jgi:hypothetical protein